MPSSNKCLNHEHCKGYALNGEKFCEACRAAGYGSKLYDLYIDQHAEDRAKYDHKQKGKK